MEGDHLCLLPKRAETDEVGSVCGLGASCLGWRRPRTSPEQGMRVVGIKVLSECPSQQRMQNEDEEAEDQGGHDEEDACNPKSFFVALELLGGFSRDPVGEVQHVAQGPTDV